MRIGLIILSILCSTFTPALSQKVEVREATLSNGMKLLLVERHEAPTIACGWVARVGSVNERPGITGISHLFEHMMFKGTHAIGIKDFEKGMEIQKRQDEVRGQMEEEYSALREKLRLGEISGNIYDPDNQTPRLKELKAELEKLYAEEKEVIIKDEMDQIYTREGASMLNAFTSEDQTVYIVNIPSNKLELWFWMESDRLINPVFREFYSERDVVREERRMRVESTPTGKLNETFNAMFWQSAPYSWPVIGWASDVESITRQQAEEYFDIYYAPNNLTAVLVGDFDPDQALELAEKYFSRIPRGPEPPPEMITFETEQEGEKRLVGEAETNPTVILRYHSPPFAHHDTYALDLLSDALSGRTGRLYKSLVEEQDLAVGEPAAYISINKYGGYFQLVAQVKEGKTPEEVEAALLAELEKVKAAPLEPRELQKIKNQAMANSFRRLQSNFYLLIQLLIYDSNWHWSYINEAPQKTQAVTAEQIQQVSQRYLTKQNQNVAWYLRKEGTVPEDPVLAALPPQVKAMVKQQLEQINSIEDPSQLEQALAQSQQMLSQVPQQMKPAVEYMITKIQERLDALQEKGGN